MKPTTATNGHPGPVFPRLREIYSQAGFDLRINLNPAFFSGWADSLFCVLYLDGKPISTGGGGISLSEIYFFECLRSAACFSDIFIIGNSGGWSTLALSMIWPEADVVAMDCGMLEPPNKLYEAIDFDRRRGGAENDFGIELTNRLARDNALGARVIKGTSPQDLAEVVGMGCKGPPDLVFIDGGHSNDQLMRDFEGLQPLVSDDCVYIFHDVVNWHLERGFRHCCEISGRKGRLLWRTSSGMAILPPDAALPGLLNVVEAFSENEAILLEFKRRAPMRKMASRIEKLPEDSLPGKVKTLLKWVNGRRIRGGKGAG